MTKAEQAVGRIASVTVNIKLISPETHPVGETDYITGVCDSMLVDVFGEFKRRAEADGFRVSVERISAVTY